MIYNKKDANFSASFFTIPQSRQSRDSSLYTREPLLRRTLVPLLKGVAQSAGGLIFLLRQCCYRNNPQSASLTAPCTGGARLPCPPFLRALQSGFSWLPANSPSAAPSAGGFGPAPLPGSLRGFEKSRGNLVAAASWEELP